MDNFKEIGKAGIILMFLLLIYAATSYNPLATGCAILLPFLLFKLLWKVDESPFLFMAFCLQWLSVTVKIFYANFMQLDFIEVFDNYKNIEKTYYASLFGILSVSAGIHFIIKNYKVEKTDYAEIALRYDSRKLVPMYLIVTLLYPFILNYSYSTGGLQQPVTKLADFKWMIFFTFMMSTLFTRQYKLFFLITGLEIVLSLTGFFSNFKDYFLVLFGGLAVVYFKNLNFKQILPLAALGLMFVYMLIIWQYVKPEYRNYLNGGTVSQNSIRTTSESLSKLNELVQNVDQRNIDAGFKQTVERLSYIDFFSATIDYVPRVVPHTHGRLWGDAIGRVLQPRIFFPNKQIIDDSETTRKYSGMQVAGAESATSISLGYMTENYIDFGMPGMFISLFVYGLLIGLVYKYVMTSSPDKLIGTAMIIPLFILIYLFESALNKLIGGLLMYLLIYELIRRFALKRFLQQIKI
ncbi:hypothetical protein HDC90_000105 [Pedobacter sp. AK013]|uniref:hypothetical protein n=1 Tax=Pedobacter sp. AK013 TaxID=2723071 RepID=UPI00160E3BA3|nr:hypothetical protein [Pedobacter sp. AK013]MBB6235508.1 hypothetical protein [Pedobacter sp. AK013]